MGAWIEISIVTSVKKHYKSHPTMGAWIEILINSSSLTFLTSHPTMGAWIEIEMVRKKPPMI